MGSPAGERGGSAAAWLAGRRGVLACGCVRVVAGCVRREHLLQVVVAALQLGVLVDGLLRCLALLHELEKLACCLAG